MTTPPHIDIARIYDDPAERGGLRILVDRLWPRGISKERARLDLWAKEIAPSNDLRKWVHAAEDRWDEFVERYRAELAASPGEVDDLRRRIGDAGTATLLYSVRDPERNHAAILRNVLLER